MGSPSNTTGCCGGSFASKRFLHYSPFDMIFSVHLRCFVILGSTHLTSKTPSPSFLMQTHKFLLGSTLTVRSSPSFPIRWFHCYSLHVGQYSAHILRQEADLRVFMEDESLLLDPLMDYSTVTGLSSEVKERLFKLRPTTMVSSLHRSMLLY